MSDSMFIVSFSITVGATIAIDIFFFTLAQAAGKNLGWKSWTLPTAIAHSVLMGATVGLFNLLGNVTYLVLPLSFLGTTIISRYLYELTANWRGKELIFSMTSCLETKFSHSVLLSWINASVLAVSWDCIPVAAGIAAETDTWTITQLVSALLIIGVTVALITQSSLMLASLVKRSSKGVSFRTKIFGVLLGNWAVLSLLSGFLILSVTKSVSLFVSGNYWILTLPQAASIGAVGASLFFYRYRQNLWSKQASEMVP